LEETVLWPAREFEEAELATADEGENAPTTDNDDKADDDDEDDADDVDDEGAEKEAVVESKDADNDDEADDDKDDDDSDDDEDEVDVDADVAAGIDVCNGRPITDSMLPSEENLSSIDVSDAAHPNFVGTPT
jgi:hypothetical protein